MGVAKVSWKELYADMIMLVFAVEPYEADQGQKEAAGHGFISIINR